VKQEDLKKTEFVVSQKLMNAGGKGASFDEYEHPKSIRQWRSEERLTKQAQRRA
jgi:hypothetical protein